MTTYGPPSNGVMFQRNLFQPQPLRVVVGDLPGTTGILFQFITNPFWPMPLVAVADLGNLPSTLTGDSTAAEWTSWPAWVAQPHENETAFKQRIIAACRAMGPVGRVVNGWQHGGFWPLNQSGGQLIYRGLTAQ
jgi:hypothetical protein